jgi:hypothetical protein
VQSGRARHAAFTDLTELFMKGIFVRVEELQFLVVDGQIHGTGRFGSLRRKIGGVSGLQIPVHAPTYGPSGFHSDMSPAPFEQILYEQKTKRVRLDDEMVWLTQEHEPVARQHSIQRGLRTFTERFPR